MAFKVKARTTVVMTTLGKATSLLPALLRGKNYNFLAVQGPVFKKEKKISKKKYSCEQKKDKKKLGQEKSHDDYI